MTPCQADLALRREIAATTGQPMTPSPYDVLEDVAQGQRWRRALEEAKSLCAKCPIWHECLSANRDEQWAQAILGIDRPKDSKQQEKAQRRHKANNAARLEALRELIAQGAEMAEVCERLGITRDGLYKWCHYHGYRDEWRTISPPRPEVIGLRTRHRKERAA